MAEWTKAVDCKSIEFVLRWFESNLLYNIKAYAIAFVWYLVQPKINGIFE